MYSTRSEFQRQSNRCDSDATEFRVGTCVCSTSSTVYVVTRLCAGLHPRRAEDPEAERKGYMSGEDVGLVLKPRVESCSVSSFGFQ